MFYNHLTGHIEALLFASGQPLTIERLEKILNIPREHIKLLIEQLRQEMASSSRGLTIVEVAGGFQLCTKPELYTVVAQLAQTQQVKLSSAALETLAIVAFKQPVTRQEIESIRGVNSERIINHLLELEFIKETGRKEAVGRPILYGTTHQFLNVFGLNSLEELPPLGDIFSIEDE